MIRGTLFWAFLVISTPLAFVRPWLGMLIYLGVTHTGAIGFVWEDWAVRYGLFLGGATLIGYVLFELRRSPPPWSRLGLMFALWACFGMATWTAYSRAWASPMLEEYSRMLVMAILVAAMVRTKERAGEALNVIAGSLGLLGSHGFSVALRGRFTQEIQGPNGMLNDRNDYALALDMGFTLLFVMADAQPTAFRRKAFRTMAIFCAISAIATRSRGGFLGLVFATLLLCLFSRRKGRALLVLAVAAVLFVNYAPKETLDRYRTIGNAAEDDGSAIGRIHAWETAGKMIKAHPWLGVGPRNFVLVFNYYSNYESRVAHNTFLGLAAEDGIPACTIYVLMLLTSIGSMLRQRRRLIRHDPGSPMILYCQALAIALMTFIVPAFFLNRQNFDLVYNLIAVRIGLTAIVQRHLAELTKKPLEQPAPALSPYDPDLEEAGAVAGSPA